MDKARTLTQRYLGSMPDNFDIIEAGTTLEGSWSGIRIWGAAFGNNTTDIEINGVGKNLSALNAGLADGDMIMGSFTKIVIALGSAMVILAYRGQ